MTADQSGVWGCLTVHRCYDAEGCYDAEDVRHTAGSTTARRIGRASALLSNARQADHQKQQRRGLIGRTMGDLRLGVRNGSRDQIW